ncbi:MAG: NUMOD3 domain-containing DNA-binding protein [Candidatus Obscuribacterales bacterium]|jgi:hypothetical protein
MRSHDFTRHRNQHYKNIVKKFGKVNIGVFVFLCDSEHQAFDDEIHQIAQLRSDGFALVNMTNGGDGVSGLVHSDAARTKMSIAGKGRRKSQETRARISAGSVGKPKTSGNTGNRHSPETKRKIAAAMVGNINRARSPITL